MKYSAAAEKRKKSFAAALKTIMERKPLSKITINELVNECGVNRKTFYYHFSDIYDLLKWMLEKEAVEMVRHFDLAADTEEAISFAIDYVQANHHILSCAYDTVGREGMRRFFHSDFINIISAIIDRTAERENIRADENFKRFLADFYTEALSGLIIDLFTDNFKYSREEIISNMALILKSTLPHVLAAKYDGEANQPRCQIT